MDLLKDDIKKVYFKYLTAAFGSALITSIYSIVDMAMVGQYHGPDGSAALAIVAPIWNIVCSLGVLTGIGGSVLFSSLRGQAAGNEKRSNEYFTMSVLLSALLSIAVWIMLVFFDRPIFQAFGAEGKVLEIALNYIMPIKYFSPLFLLNIMISAYLRNDKAPVLATAGVLAGGIFNIFGDYFFVFVCDMGSFGAGVATAMGAVITFVIQITHFFSKKNTLHFVRPSRMIAQAKAVLVTGFSTFFLDIAAGIITIIFNTQIMLFLGNTELAVYGVIANIAMLAQCCAYSIGQAAQPIISTNFGAGQGKRITGILKYALLTAALFGAFWTVICVAVPNGVIHLFMSPTAEVLNVAPHILRCYTISFFIMPFNIFAAYYFQAIMKPAASFIVSVGRGLVVSGILILLLPRLIFADAIWFAMPITEAVILIYAVVMIRKYTSALKSGASAI
jgi:putative MATE family efflux protein